MDPRISDHVIFPREVVLKGSKKDSPEQNKIKIDCNFSTVIKDLALDFILLGHPNRQMQDVRRFKVLLNIQHPPLVHDLVMMTTARKTIIQPFPIQNNSHKDWKLRASISENQLRNFSLKEGQLVNSKQFIIRKGQIHVLNIFFEPIWICQVLTRVTIHNLTTNEQILLHIKGMADEPLSQDHIHIRADFEESSLQTINITNPCSEKLIYQVCSDIDQLQLPPDVTLEPNQTVPFSIYFKCIEATSQIGYIKFIDDYDRFFWYSIALESSEKKTRQFSVEISGEVGSDVEKKILFKNPFSKPLLYKVEYPKGVGLEAKQEFTIVPHGSFEYHIKYRPERAVDQEAILKAVSEQIGTFLYKIKLKAKDETKKKPIQLSAEVGKIAIFDLKLENPRAQNVKVNYSLSNTQYFNIDGPQMIHPGQNIIRISFKPNSEGKQLCTIRVWSQHFPTRCFQIEGVGLAPYSIESIHFKTRPNETSLQVIRFTNPNLKRTSEDVKVCLSEDKHGYFSIVGHESEVVWRTEVNDLLAIPIQFKPQAKGYFESVLTVQCFHYQWKYLLKGTTSLTQELKISEQIKTVNKQQIIKRFKLNIPEYYDQNASYFDKVTIEHSDKNLCKLLRSWLKLRISPPSEDEKEEKQIIILAKFKPKKQFKEVVQLVLSSSKEEGPTLTTNIQLIVAEGPPDSSIILDITAIKTAAFELNNLGLQASVSSKMLKGTYCKAEKLGGSVKLIFKPTHLLFTKSRYYTDNLLVENHEEQWNYELKFCLKN